MLPPSKGRRPSKTQQNQGFLVDLQLHQTRQRLEDHHPHRTARAQLRRRVGACANVWHGREQARCRCHRSHVEVAGGRTQHVAGPRRPGRRRAGAGRPSLGSRRGGGPEVRGRRLFRGADDPKRGERQGPRRGDQGAGWRLPHRRARPGVGGIGGGGLPTHPSVDGRSEHRRVQRRLSRGPGSPARDGAPRAPARRAVRHGDAHRRAGTIPRRQGGPAGDASRRAGHLPHHQQPVIVARTQALHRPVVVLPEGHDAGAGAGADRGVLRARRPRRQRDRRRPDRLARHACVAPGAAAARGRHGPGEDRRRLLVPAHPGPLGLDP
jgi:hypothetical protein